MIHDIIFHDIGYDEKSFKIQPQPVQFTQEPNDYIVFLGVDINFVCTMTITSLNNNSITWFHNNAIIEPGPHYNITSDDHGTSILTVRNVTTDDQGEYHCCVSEWRNKVRSRYGHVAGKLCCSLHMCYFLFCSVK